MSGLPDVRRFEAAGFRAWPAASVHYDGTWVVRLTPGHPAKRLNSINPLDPADVGNLEARIASAHQRFAAAGAIPTFRLTPLSGRPLSQHLDRLGWSQFDESMVMRLDLDRTAVDAAMDQIPLKDVARFVADALSVRGQDASVAAALTALIEAIPSEAGLFVLEQRGAALAATVCVHDGDLAGLFEMATHADHRREGHGRRLLLSALKWARLRGAREAWLQVDAANAGALALYGSLGFHEVYRYHYRRPPEAPT